MGILANGRQSAGCQLMQVIKNDGGCACVGVHGPFPLRAVGNQDAGLLFRSLLAVLRYIYNSLCCPSSYRHGCWQCYRVRRGIEILAFMMHSGGRPGRPLQLPDSEQSRPAHRPWRSLQLSGPTESLFLSCFLRPQEGLGISYLIQRRRIKTKCG